VIEGETMNIANEPSASISVQALSKKNQSKGKTEAYLGKVIAKSGKEIQVLINDKVYKIEPGNAESIKVGDKIQIFFGKNLPAEISEEMLKKISGKLLDVYSLSLPYQTTRELEDIINQMPQNERLQFAKISNELVQLIETILKDEYGLQTLSDSDAKKESVNLYNPSEPFNRRLIELSLKVKEMGKAWDQIPNEIKKEIVKKYVLFDFQKKQISTSENMKEVGQFSINNDEKKDLENLISQSAVNKQASHGNLSHDFDLKQFNEEKEIPNNMSQNDQIDNRQIKKGNLNIEKKDVDSFSPMEVLKKVDGRTVSERNGMEKVSSDNRRLNQNEKMIATDNSESEEVSSKQKMLMNSLKDLNKTEKHDQEIIPQTNNENHKIEKALIESLKYSEQKSLGGEKDLSFSQKPLPAFSEEDMRKVSNILQNTLSKPLSMETNLEQLEKLSKISFSESEKTDQSFSQNQFDKFSSEQHSNSVLKLLENLIAFDKMSKASFPSYQSVSDHRFPDLTSVEAFDKMIKTSLMSMEIQEMFSSLKSYGVTTHDAYHTTLDIVNIAARSIKEHAIAPQIYSSALTKFLKLSLPQLIINHQIDLRDEEGLFKKVESFSKKVFMIIKAYAERLMANKEQELHPSNVKIDEKEEIPNQNNRLKTATNNQNQMESKVQLVKNTGETESGFANPLKDQQGKSGASSQQMEQMPKTTSEIRTKEGTMDNINQKELGSTIPTNQKNQLDQNIQSEKGIPIESKPSESSYRNEIGSEKILKFLNVSPEKTDFSTAYSSLISVNSQPFVIDLQHQMMNKSGYEKSEMYRVFIETNTQLFGTVFVDTVVTDNKIDIYIYAEQQYAKAFTNHSSTLIKRIKETDYQLRGLFIREKLDQNGILKHKMKRFSNLKKEGGFYQLA